MKRPYEKPLYALERTLQTITAQACVSPFFIGCGEDPPPPPPPPPVEE